MPADLPDNSIWTSSLPPCLIQQRRRLATQWRCGYVNSVFDTTAPRQRYHRSVWQLRTHGPVPQKTKPTTFLCIYPKGHSIAISQPLYLQKGERPVASNLPVPKTGRPNTKVQPDPYRPDCILRMYLIFSPSQPVPHPAQTLCRD